MCRFLLVKSKEKIKPEKLLNQFARMCEKSSAPDGDWQGDGWGIAIKDQISNIKDQKWDEYKSLSPIWEEEKKFQHFKPTNIFVVHARSAGFPQHKGIIDYNQPYIWDDLCFVFNGMIKGVNLVRRLEGNIGAQKIFSLILQEQKNNSIDNTLRFVDKLLLDNAKKIIGMNIGIVKDNKFYMLCEYDNNANYFGLRYYRNDSITLVCSEAIGKYCLKVMKKSEVLVL